MNTPRPVSPRWTVLNANTQPRRWPTTTMVTAPVNPSPKGGQR